MLGGIEYSSFIGKGVLPSGTEAGESSGSGNWREYLDFSSDKEGDSAPANPVASQGAAQEALPQAPAPAEVAHPAPNEEEVSAIFPGLPLSDNRT